VCHAERMDYGAWGKAKNVRRFVRASSARGPSRKASPLGPVGSDPLRHTALRSPGLSAEDNPDQTGRFVEGMFTSDVVTYGKQNETLVSPKRRNRPA